MYLLPVFTVAEWNNHECGKLISVVYLSCTLLCIGRVINESKGQFKGREKVFYCSCDEILVSFGTIVFVQSSNSRNVRDVECKKTSSWSK